MACPAIITGDRFLLRVVEHIDCQAQLLGSYGYQALGQPGSLASNFMLGLLTLFIALFALRLLFGPVPGTRDVVFDLLKVGIVLTLAFSWPAFRTVVHDVVIDGPAQVASVISTPGLSDGGDRLAVRMQKADTAMVRLAELGTGRFVGASLEGERAASSFAGTSLQDDWAMGYGRMLYLAGILGSLVVIRIIAALLLALAPLAAGLLLFEATRGLFSGWLKGLSLSVLGSIGVTVLLAVELSILEPWLSDALRVRGLGFAAPSAPIELFAIATAFAIAKFAVIWLLAKVAFTRGWPTMPRAVASAIPNVFNRSHATISQTEQLVRPSRAQRIADTIETTIRREQSTETRRMSFQSLLGERPGGASAESDQRTKDAEPQQARLGSTYRRTGRRNSFNALRKGQQS